MASGGLYNTAVEWKPGVAQQFQTKVFRLHPSECTQILVQYREPDVSRSIFELTVTLVPFVALWALAWWSLSISTWLASAIALGNVAFLIRLFLIQHVCSRWAFFQTSGARRVTGGHFT